MDSRQFPPLAGAERALRRPEQASISEMRRVIGSCPKEEIAKFVRAHHGSTNVVLTFPAFAVQAVPPTRSTMASSMLATLSNYLKPHRAEAISRIRTNSFWLVALLLVTYLLPTPFLLNFTKWNSVDLLSYIWKIGARCLRQALSSPDFSDLFSELTVGSLLTYNILQSAYAIKYPRQPLPSISPKKRTAAAPTPTKAKRLSELVSPPVREHASMTSIP